MEEYITRLIAIGFYAPSAWAVCFDYFQRRDYDGLEAYIAKIEGARHVHTI